MKPNEVVFRLEGDIMTAFLRGEIDHASAEKLRRMIDEKLRLSKPAVLKLDFARVAFMDSSGIGLILGRIRLMKLWNGRVILCNISESTAKMAKIAGVFSFASIDRNTRITG